MNDFDVIIQNNFLLKVFPQILHLFQLPFAVSIMNDSDVRFQRNIEVKSHVTMIAFALHTYTFAFK